MAEACADAGIVRSENNGGAVTSCAAATDAEVEGCTAATHILCRSQAEGHQSFMTGLLLETEGCNGIGCSLLNLLRRTVCADRHVTG